MTLRSQVGGDQLNLLARGWLLASSGVLVPFGNPTSAGGVEPGGLTSVLVGLPLVFWTDHRAPVFLILLGHLVGYLLLDRVVRDALGERGRWLVCALYWANPWRLYHSAFLWNPNHLFLFGAIHTWSAYRLRQAPRKGASFLHGLALTAATQLHAATVILILVSIVLVARRLVKPHWPTLVAGAAAGSVTLLPWLATVLADPSIMPGGSGYPGRGLLLVFPVAKGLLYWLRYSSLFLPGRAMTLDFQVVGGVDVAVLETGLEVAFGALGLVGVGAAAFANLRLLRRRWWRRSGESVGRSPRRWLETYTAWTLVAVLASFALSPTTPQSWQALIVLHVAVLPAVLLGATLSRSRRHQKWVWRAAGGVAATSLCLGAVLALGSPHFRCGGEGGFQLALRHDSSMLRDLGIQSSCPIPTERKDGWWPDVLPPGEIAAGPSALRRFDFEGLRLPCVSLLLAAPSVAPAQDEGFTTEFFIEGCSFSDRGRTAASGPRSPS